MPPDASPARPGRYFGLLLLCFFLSGLAALIYQTAWTRQFAFVFGTSELAVASVLAAYMGGLALGAAVIGRIAPRIQRPIWVYGLLELAIGLTALAVPLGVGAATSLYIAIFGAQNAPADEGGLLTALFYLVCSFVILLVPTSLMGATLPLLARHAVRREEEIGSRVAQLYATNTAGAVVGTVLTGFVLLPALGLSLTIWVAVCANGLVFAAAAALALRAPAVEPTPVQRATPDPRAPNRWILPLIAISGAVSFTYEVFWTRLLGHVLGGSVYAFATMLATFLLGIALGSALASGRLVADRRTATTAFAWVQIGTGLLSLAAYVAIDSTPGWVASSAVRGDARLLLDAGISAAILLPGALCIGATFPLAVRVLARSREEAGPASARVYAWNTVGAIAGAVGAGFFLIPAVGFTWTIVIAVSTNAALAAATALRARPRSTAAAVAAVAVCVAIAGVRPEPPWQLLRTGALSTRVRQAPIVYFGVGRGATVMVQRAPNGFALSSNGLPEAVINGPGVRVGRYVIGLWLAQLASWGRPEAKSMLVIGLGGGLVVEAVPPLFEKIDVVEIEPLVIRANEVIASERREDPLADPRLELIVNDARSALLLTDERYDTIVSQPSHPWTGSASHLYTREFFELVKNHLAEDGVFVQWMGLGFIDEDLLRTLVATLQDVFPYVRVYQPAPGGLLFSASAAPFEPERLASEAIRLAPDEAAEFGIYGGADIVVHMMLDEEAARVFAAGAPVSTDDRNLLQMRSPRVVRSVGRLDPDPLFAPLDPLVRDALAWDRAYLIRRALASGHTGRARRLAEAASDPVERNVALGLMAQRRGDAQAAASAYRRALADDPRNGEAQIALLGFSPTGNVDDAFDVEPIPYARLLLEAWQLANASDWTALRERDASLAAVHAHDPAFAEAGRLRARWRLAEGGKENALVALQLLDGILATGGSGNDLVLRARAAAAAGFERGVASSINELLRKNDASPAHTRALSAAIVAIDGLPPGLLDAKRQTLLRNKVRAQLRKRQTG